jgi:hypothetical protein
MGGTARTDRAEEEGEEAARSDPWQGLCEEEGHEEVSTYRRSASISTIVNMLAYMLAFAPHTYDSINYGIFKCTLRYAMNMLWIC